MRLDELAKRILDVTSERDRESTTALEVIVTTPDGRELGHVVAVDVGLAELRLVLEHYCAEPSW